MIKKQFSKKRIKHFLTSFILSTLIVGVFVGNAYITTGSGYPGILQSVGEALYRVGFVVAIPPGIGFWALQKLGLGWELRGRESFFELNIALWIYCVIFYTFFFYLIFRIWDFRHIRRKSIPDGDTGDGASMCEKGGDA